MDAVPERFYYVPLPRVPRSRLAGLWRSTRVRARDLSLRLRSVRAPSIRRGLPAWISDYKPPQASWRAYGRPAAGWTLVVLAAVVIGIVVVHL